MPQQINLLDASLQRQPQRLGSLLGVSALAVTLCLSAALSASLHALTARDTRAAGNTELQLQQLQALPPAASLALVDGLQADVQRLRAKDAGQHRVLGLLATGDAESTQGYSSYLMALSRQSRASLWLTGFSVAPEGHAIELHGRMTDPLQLPEYLQRLNLEPLFRGRKFAQMSLTAVERAHTNDSANGANSANSANNGNSANTADIANTADARTAAARDSGDSEFSIRSSPDRSAGR